MRLPPLQLEHAGEPVRLDAPELGALALLFVRTPLLPAARAYIESWEQKRTDLMFWLGRPILISDGELPGGQLTTAMAPASAWEALGIGPHDGALIITDRWSVIYVARSTRTFSDLPPVTEVEEWLRYLATQCPECGVIDEPGYGEWTP
ncbi:MAG: hypothetical protein ACREMA_13960 [Longimicrobiales bacterium]